MWVLVDLEEDRLRRLDRVVTSGNDSRCDVFRTSAFRLKFEFGETKPFLEGGITATRSIARGWVGIDDESE